MEKVKGFYKHDPHWTALISQYMVDVSSLPQHSFKEGILRYKGRLCIGSHENMKQKLIELIHASSEGGHMGIQATYQKAKAYFYWPHTKRELKAYMLACDVCQRNKGLNTSPVGLL